MDKNSMDKNSKNMLKQVLGALSHMTSLDVEGKNKINAELDRIENKLPVKKKGAVIVVKRDEDSISK